MDSAPASTEPVPASLPRIAPQQAIVWVLFLFSGICGLIYEVLWCRHLGLIFGNTVQSMSAVLTAFMAGLALGSYVGGRVCHRLTRPMMAYGILELAIGIYCAFLPWAFSAESPVIPLYRNLYGEAGGGTSLSVARFAISFVLLLIPTTFMGATLPVLSQYLVRSRAFFGRTVGALYAVNTFGAVLGAALTGFILLPVLGKANSNWLAVISNIILGTLAIVFGMNSSAPAHVEGDSPESPCGADEGPEDSAINLNPGGQVPVSPLALKLAILTFGLTGFAALTTQIGWNRAISLAMGSSTYVFSLIVSVFILGLSFGGAWGARAAEKTHDPLALLGKVLIAIGLGSIALTVLLGIGPKLLFALVALGKDAGWNWLQAFQALGIGLLIIGPTFMMGATLPLTMQVAARTDGAPGRTVGTIYAVNTVGSILGSFIGGLVILPWLEIRGTLLLMSMLYAAPGLVLYLMSKSGRDRKPRSEFTISMIAILTILAVLFGSPQWDPLTMSSGMYLLRNQTMLSAVKKGNWSEVFSPNLHKDTELKYYNEGATATVAVTRIKEYLFAPDDVKDEPLESNPANPVSIDPPVMETFPQEPPSRYIFSLTVGGKPDASSHGDMSTQLGLTLIPVLLHEKPESVLVIGLGSGASAGAALAPDSVKNVDVVEMSPEVVEASFFFAPFTGLAYKARPGRDRYWLDTPRLNLIVNDARNHLLLTSKKYDVIASEPSNPWLAGVGNLFTQEAFQLTHDHLNPGGIMCQWIHSYSLEETDFFSIVKTFGTVFKHMQLWCVNRRDFLLIGADAPINLDILKLRARMAQKNVKPLLESIRFDSEEEFIACFMSTDSELRNVVKGAPLHTDDNMRLEFSTPKALYNTLQQLRSTQFEPDPESLVDLSALSAAERHAMEERLDFAASGREHTRCAFEHAGNRIDHWVKALALAPKQFWAVEYRKFIEDAVKKRPAEKAPAPRDEALEKIKELAEREGEVKALDTLQKLSNKRATDGVTTFECAELAVKIMRANGDSLSARKMLAITLQKPGMAVNPHAALLWAAWAELTLETEKPDVDAAFEIARRADALARAKGTTLDAAGRIALKSKIYAEAYNEYRFLCATLPNRDDFKIGLADTLIGIAGVPQLRTEKLEAALRKLRFALRVSREATHFLDGEPAAWVRLAQVNLELSKLDPAAAEFHKSEAQNAWARVLELDKGNVLKGVEPQKAGTPALTNPALKGKLLRLEETFKMDADSFMQLFSEMTALKK